MDLPKYQLSAENTLTVFEFVSIGPNGNIPKLIKFSETHLKDFYNLGFGDKSIDTGEINDKIVSNNGDSDKVLATVVSAVYAFTDLNPNIWVYATGSTRARTRLYRMGIGKYFSKVKVESSLKTNKTKKVSFGHIFIFFNQLILRHHWISKNKNLPQNNSFYANCLFLDWTQS